MSRIICEASPEKTQKQVDRCYDELGKVQNRGEPVFDYYNIIGETDEGDVYFFVTLDTERSEYIVAWEVHMNAEDYYLRISTARDYKEVMKEYDAFKQNSVNDVGVELDRYKEYTEEEKERIRKKLEEELEEARKELEEKIREKEKERTREKRRNTETIRQNT